MVFRTAFHMVIYHQIVDFSIDTRHREASSSFSIAQQKGTEGNTNFVESLLGETDVNHVLTSHPQWPASSKASRRNLCAMTFFLSMSLSLCLVKFGHCHGTKEKPITGFDFVSTRPNHWRTCKRCTWLHFAPIRMSPCVTDNDPLTK